MRTVLSRLMASLLVVAFVATAYSQQQQEVEQRNAVRPDAEQQIEQTLEHIQREMEAQARTVQAPESAIWVLASLPPELMAESVKYLPHDAERSAQLILQSAGVLRLQAATAGPQEREHAERLIEAASELERTGFRVYFRQTATLSDLRQPFAEAAMAGAEFFQQQARLGFDARNADLTGYSLRASAQYLTAAHAFANTTPSADAALAAYNAHTAGQQIIHTARPTTYAARRAAEEVEAEPAVARIPAQEVMPPETDQVIRDLQSAIQRTTFGFEQDEAQRN